MDKEKELKSEVSEASEESSEQQQEPTLEERLQQMEQEKSELRDKWLRTAAEFDNFRKRSIAEKSDWIRNANQRLVLELCDVIDNFERAFSAESAEQDAASFHKGIELIYRQFENILKRENVEKIAAEGKEFDPAYHEALAHIPSDKAENEIVAVIRNGYLMNGKVIRAARVAVANGETLPVAEKTEKKKKKEINPGGNHGKNNRN